MQWNETRIVGQSKVQIAFYSPSLIGHLKGRNPPMAMCTAVCLYQGCSGIWRGMLRVRHGAWKLPARFLPTIPPMTVRGKPTNTQAPSNKSTVDAGSACVDPLHQCTEFTTLQVRKRGAEGENSKITTLIICFNYTVNIMALINTENRSPVWIPYSNNAKTQNLTGEEGGGENDVPNPALTMDLGVEATGAVSRNTASQRIQYNCCRIYGSMVMHIKHPEQCHDDNS